MDVSKMRIAIIGSGVSGILAIKACREEIQLFDQIVCFERTSSIGGLWKYRENQDEDNPEVADETVTVMNGTIANSSKELSAFSDFPPPPYSPNFMHHKLMYQYIMSYAKKFDCLQHIRYNSEVTEVSRAGDRWIVMVRNTNSNNNITSQPRREYFDAVLICSGHHGRPVIPSYPGHKNFKGNIIHTQKYKKPAHFRGQNVVIVGAGNSGLDAAVELSAEAENVYLSTRSGCWVLPRLGFRGGRPYDTSFLTRSMHVLKDLFPSTCISFVIETMLNRRFDHQLFGLRPAHPLFHEHPTVNDQLACKILCGTITVKGDIERLLPDSVCFSGEEDHYKVDTILLATGYHVEYPFLSKELSHCLFDDGSDQNSVNLYKYVFPIIENDDGEAVKSLAFIGVPNALGPLFPIAEMQARWVIQVLAGAAALPPVCEMREYLRHQEHTRKRKFTNSRRHGVQVEWIPYLDEIAAEIGCKLDFWRLFATDFKLWLKLFFGPSLPYQYRLQGPHPWPGARDAIFGANQRIELPLAVIGRVNHPGKDDVSNNPLYTDHNLLFALFWGILGALFMDVIFFFT